MRKIGFIGAYDKTDFILFVAKILAVLGNKVLVIDSSINQKAKYVVPVINPTKSYVTCFENIDVAVGFDQFGSIKEYLGINQDAELPYDIALIDVDSIVTFGNFGMTAAEKNFFVTSFDLFSLKKGLEILSGITEQITMTKIIFTKDIIEEDDDYLNFLSRFYKIAWTEEKLYFPLENGDQAAIISNQRTAKIKLRNISIQYKESLEFMVEMIVPEVSPNEVKKIMKNIEKGA